MADEYQILAEFTPMMRDVLFAADFPMPVEAAVLYGQLADVLDRMPGGHIGRCEDGGPPCALCFLADLGPRDYTHIVAFLLKFFTLVGPSPEFLRTRGRQGAN